MTTARTLPVWKQAEDTTRWFRTDLDSHDLDVAVVGAGIAGLTAALCLLRDGRDVVVIDKEGVGAGETLRTSAHLANALDERFHRLARQHGKDGARLAAASHGAAIDWIETLVGETSRDCGFRRVPGYLFAHDGNESRLETEVGAAIEAGLDAALLSAGEELPASFGGVIRFERQAIVDAGLYLDALASEVRDAGGRFLRAEVVGITGGESCTINLRHGELKAKNVVAATNVPVHETGATYMKQAAYRSYVVAGDAPDDLPDALIWDDADPYHYVRRYVDGDGVPKIIVGGEDHKTGQDDDPEAYVRLQAWTREHFPGATHFTHGWSGQIIEPVDGLAFIGRDPDNDNVFLVTGDSGNGLTHGTLAGLLIADLAQGRANPWESLYDPSRKPVRSAGEWIRENANAALQFRDWVRPADVDDPQHIALGTGAVLRQGAHRIACYRSGDGSLHTYNARCPHMGCVVRWSGEEKSWDCPCHGSRFDGETGAILNGPTSEPLAPMRLERK